MTSEFLLQATPRELLTLNLFQVLHRGCPICPGEHEPRSMSDSIHRLDWFVTCGGRWHAPEDIGISLQPEGADRCGSAVQLAVDVRTSMCAQVRHLLDRAIAKQEGRPGLRPARKRGRGSWPTA